MTRTCDRIVRSAMAIVLTLGASACGKSPSSPERAGLQAMDAVRWNLPKRLNEISGLAFSADGRLFAHDARCRLT